MSDPSRVLIVYTGGTIGMIEDPETGALRPFNFKSLSDQVPELNQLSVQLDALSFKKPIDSSDMNPEIWAYLANLINDYYDKYDGFVILHGSDTMAFTAAALSFMFENLNKPIILTGSQLPMGMIRTDGKENLITAIEIAGSRKDGAPVVSEVAIYFEYQLYRGNRTSKNNAENFEAFISPNHPVLATAGVHINYDVHALLERSSEPLKVHTDFDPAVGVLTLFPGIGRSVVEAMVRAEGLKGLVLHTFGSGNATTENWFINLLREGIRDGLVIVNVTQCAVGSVQQGLYETSGPLAEIGVIGGEDIALEAAVTKLMFLFGQGLSATEVARQFPKNLRGEITESKNH